MKTDLFSIEAKRVVITGGAAGIGRGIAERFVAEGANVVVADVARNGSAIAGAFGAEYVQMDVTDVESVETAMRGAADKLGGEIDVLILNAGIDREVGVAGDFDLDSFRAVMEVNFQGVVNGLAVGPGHMREGGSIIVTSSPAGRLTMAGLGAYSASKAAVDSLVRTASIELAEKGIRVNAVLPGIARTDMQGGASGDGAALAILTATNTERDPAELAPVYQFLASEAAAPVTGATLQADDGMTAGLSTHLLERAFGEGGLG